MNAMMTNGTKLHPMLLLACALAWILVSASSSLAMESSAPVYDPCWDVSCGPCQVCEGGECFDTPGAAECVDDEGPRGPQQINCEETDGIWDACAASSCDLCDDCVADCLCPSGASFDPAKGCVDLSELLFEERCALSGGTSSCQTPLCPPGEPCASICMMVCECPAEMVWSHDDGCVEPPRIDELCAETGGEMVCAAFTCPEGDPSCAADLACEERCDCPEGQAYDALRGCVAAPIVDPDVDDGAMGSQPGGDGTGGCTGGGSGAPNTALMLCLCFALALSRRRMSSAR